MTSATETARAGVNYGDQRMAEANEILRTEAGSGVHGIAIKGRDDYDEMGVFIEPREHCYGLLPPAETHSWRTKGEGERSGPGDTDRVIYPLRKYLALAAKGNPTALTPLFAHRDSIIVLTPLGLDLRKLRGAFLTQECVRRFVGYMEAQRQRMLGVSNRNVPNRPELIEQFGWDVKYGSHALRLAYQGREVCDDGHLSLPMRQKERLRVIDVKLGKVPREDVVAEIADIEVHIQGQLSGRTCMLPDSPDWQVIGGFSMMAHEAHWYGTEDRGRRPVRTV